ncbi:MAG: protein kinase [Chloroflexota bacterium]
MANEFGKLILIAPDQTENERLLQQPIITIGTAATNDIVIPWGGIQADHGRLVCTEHGCQLVEKASGQTRALVSGKNSPLGAGFIRFEANDNLSDAESITVPGSSFADQTSQATFIARVDADTDVTHLHDIADRTDPPPLLDAETSTPFIVEMIGRYQVEEDLGRRGIFVVYRAHDPELARKVAIKILAPEFAANDEFRAKVRAEVELIALLEHPAIVQVYDFGEHNGQPFVVMPFMEGGTLTTRLQESPLSLKQLIPPGQ